MFACVFYVHRSLSYLYTLVIILAIFLEDFDFSFTVLLSAPSFREYLSILTCSFRLPNRSFLIS